MEYVILVDEENNQIGTAPKDTVHTNKTPLHRGFSLFLFNSKKQTLLTKRAGHKKTFPGVWSNAVCGHPGVNETVIDAAARRLKDELGLTDATISLVSDYRYRFVDNNGVVENEICPILLGYSESNPVINKEESDEWKWVDWKVFLEDVRVHSSIYSPWCKEEAEIIEKLPPINRG